VQRAVCLSLKRVHEPGPNELCRLLYFRLNRVPSLLHASGRHSLTKTIIFTLSRTRKVAFRTCIGQTADDKKVER